MKKISIFMACRYLIMFLVSLVSFNIAIGQKISNEYFDTLVNNYVDELRANGIDTFCIYQDYCVGCSYMWQGKDTCNFGGLFVPTYIFWKNKGQTFMTIKDNCFDYSIIEIPRDSIWSFFFKNQDIIKKEEIKIPQYVEIKNGKEEVFSSIIDHSQHQRIKIIVGQNTVINKDINDYYLEKEIGYFGGDKNINYEYNINSYLNNFRLLIDRIIEAPPHTLIKTRR